MKTNFKIYIIISILFIIISQIACKIEKIEKNISPTIQNTIENIPTKTQIVLSKNSNFEKGIVVNCEYLNIRKYSDENSEIFYTISKNSEVIILSKETNWYEIMYVSENKIHILGYVNSKYIEVVNEKDSP